MNNTSVLFQKFWGFLYTYVVLPLLVGILYLQSFRDKKIKDSLDGRQGFWGRLDAQIIRRDLRKPLIWFHVVSAGELLQAQPVMERLLRNGYECALTVSSITGYKWAQRLKLPDGYTPVVVDFLPLDFPYNVRRLLAILQPSAVIYVKFDLWPNLIWETHAAGIPQYLISATLQPKSLRVTNRVGRAFYRTLYACLQGIYAVSPEDRQRFLLTNPDHPNVVVAGDTRFDSVLDRKNRLPVPKFPDYVKEKFVIVIGSSWPPDEECIFPGLADALEQFPDVLLIIVPHEPTTEHLEHTETFFNHVKIERFTQLENQPETPPRIILVDTVGVLSSVYQVGHLAYVGGAFTTGVHNVMEPCVMGLPVIFGPIHYNSPEALDLLQYKLAFTIETPEAFRSLLLRLLKDPESCVRLGQQASQRIESQCGAADQCYQFISQEVR